MNTTPTGHAMPEPNIMLDLETLGRNTTAPILSIGAMPTGAQTWDKGLWYKQDRYGRVFFYSGSEWLRSTRRALPLGLSKYQIDILAAIAKACDRGTLYAHSERFVHCLNNLHWKGMIEQADGNAWRITAAGRGYLQTQK